MTRLLAYATEAFEAIWQNRARSILTMLGMIIGTSSVIAVLGIGSAASSGIAASLNAFGDPGLFVFADPRQDDPVAAGIQFRDVATIADDDVGKPVATTVLFGLNTLTSKPQPPLPCPYSGMSIFTLTSKSSPA